MLPFPDRLPRQTFYWSLRDQNLAASFVCMNPQRWDWLLTICRDALWNLAGVTVSFSSRSCPDLFVFVALLQLFQPPAAGCKPATLALLILSPLHLYQRCSGGIIRARSNWGNSVRMSLISAFTHRDPADSSLVRLCSLFVWWYLLTSCSLKGHIGFIFFSELLKPFDSSFLAN